VAEQITRSLRHGHDNASSLIRNRAMIQYGHGRYMDPEGGFFTFALMGHSAILLVEFEGDPQSPSVEKEIRHYLEAPAPEAPPSTHADGVCSIWFDANRFFHDLPKNTAAELRGQKLQRNIGFDMTLNVRPADSDKLMIAAHYNYQADRFNQSKQPSAVELLASLGPDNHAGIAGRLMDRCADTLDYDSLIERLRAVLGDSAKEGIQAVVVEKSCDTSREARFVLTASCDAKTTPPLLAAFQTLWQ